MLDHVFLSVSDIERSIAFYTQALAPLGITDRVDYDGKDGPPGHPDLKGFGCKGRFIFWLRLGVADSRAARGTIFTYGIDGVCHQLANQVLYSTTIGGAAPLTVRNARGYMASVFVYGTYGLQHAAWWNQILRCGGHPLQLPGGPAMVAAEGAPAGTPQDDFEARAREVLESEDPKLLGDLLALRADVHRFAAQRWPGFAAPDAETLNARNQHLLDQAAQLLGPEKFEKIFGFPPGRKIDLVDPKINQP